MLLCKKCKVEYEDDKRFCAQCGSFLIKKEDLLPDFEDPEKPVEEKPKEKFICPECKIIYEKTKACIRCRSEVVLLSSFQAKEKSENVQEPECEEESSRVLTARDWVETPIEHLVCAVCKKEHLGGKSCIRCGGELVPPGSPPAKEKPRPPRSPNPKKLEPKPSVPSNLEEELFGAETSETPPPKMSVEEQIKKGRLLRKVKKDYPRMVLNWSGIVIICIAAGYFLWSTYSHVVAPKPDFTVISPTQEKTSMPPPASSVAVPSGDPLAEAEEIDMIKSLLENIRKANLRKDMDLFLSCYSKDFKDREGKKKSTLESWNTFNFLDLTYALENLSISGDIARARVEWLVRFSSKSGGQPHESKTTLDVAFKKEDGTWKIGEIKSGL
jgi:ketosteroid isomerase-like protein